jgi:hypothetical protein
MADEELTLADLLKVLAHGAFHEDATQAHNSLCETMTKVATASGGIAKGSLTISLKYKMDRGVFEVDPSYKVTTPSTPRLRTMLFPDKNGRLHRANQQQLSLPGVDAPIERAVEAAPVRDVPAPEPTVREMPVAETNVRSIDFKSRASGERD